ncbi:MAG: S8 family serine peptidase, partial [Verrucomicrobiota bacterium]
MKPIHYYIALILLCGWTGSATSQTNVPAWHRKLTLPNLILDPLQQGQERVAVIVTLVPNARAKQRTDWNKAQSVQTLRAANRADSAAVLKDVAANDRRVRHEFDNQAGFSCELTQAAIEQLANDPRVASIEPVLELQMHLNQGLALMNAVTTRSTYNGTNLAIAICDTGIDYTHARLGGGGFPNSKVIGGYDFGDSDADPIPNTQAHGTCCAGIAAGNLGTVGDYVGGVAPGAKLYALKISSGTTGSASSDAMAAAWDWCVTHKNDDPNNPILVISTSFGGGRYLTSCDSATPAMTTAADNAVAAGITILASSGNDGYCDSIAWPACITSVISVGAVYDANFGNYTPCVNSASCAPKIATTGCTTGYYVDEPTAPDKVTAYSNSANFLGVFAPANKCYTLDITGASGYSTGDYYDSFGGTSAACPYAAGAVACLQNAAKVLNGSYLTPAEVRAILISSGNLVTDTKVAITKPRVNLGNAISSLAGPAPALSLTNASASDAAGNADGFVDPGETIQETIIWKNTGTAIASNLTGTVLTAPAGVTLTQPTATYANAPIGGTTTNTIPFTFRLAKSVPCGTPLLFTNVIISSTDGRAFTGTFSHVVGQLQTSGAVTNTFDSTNIPKNILDVATIYSTNTIATTGSIDDVNVTVRLNHTYDSDLVIAIQHPDTTEVILSNRRGTSGDNFGTGTCGAGELRTTFDDETATAISAGTAPFASTYRPDGVLSNFDGKAVNGIWRLRVTDAAAQDVGTLSCWGLRIISRSTSYACNIFNNPPVASNLTFAIQHGASTNLIMRGSDPDGDPFTFQTNSLPAHGTLSSLNAATGAITYTATAGYNGPDAFTFVTNDSYTNSLAGTVSITVTGTVLTPPQLLVTPASYNFGYVLTGTTVQTSFTITNLGQSLLSGDTFSVAGNSATQLLVSITPFNAGAFTSNIVFTSNGGVSTNPVTGNGAIIPVAAFNATPTNGLAPLAVNFTDLSTGTITNWLWDFGDGTTTNIVVTHLFTGSNDVRLIVTGPLGVSTSAVVTVLATNLIPTADLALTQTASANPVTLGDPLTFTLIVSNFGGATASSITITDTLPANVTFNSASPACFTNGNLVICDLATLASNAAATITFTVTPTLPGSLANTASVSATEPDPNLLNNNSALNVVVPLDADADGIPDAWELAHGLNPHTGADTGLDDDGDGFTNLQEYLAGTNPHAASSAFRITSVTTVSNDVLIIWLAGAGTTNVVQSTGAFPSNFLDISSPFIIPTGSDILTNHLDQGGATNSPQLIYRIRLQP